MVGLAVNFFIVPTNGIMTGGLIESKTDVFKTEVLTGVFTTVEELKIVELTVSTIVDVESVTK